MKVSLSIITIFLAFLPCCLCSNLSPETLAELKSDFQSKEYNQKMLDGDFDYNSYLGSLQMEVSGVEAQEVACWRLANYLDVLIKNRTEAPEGVAESIGAAVLDSKVDGPAQIEFLGIYWRTGRMTADALDRTLRLFVEGVIAEDKFLVHAAGGIFHSFLDMQMDGEPRAHEAMWTSGTVKKFVDAFESGGKNLHHIGCHNFRLLIEGENDKPKVLARLEEIGAVKAAEKADLYFSGACGDFLQIFNALKKRHYEL